MYPWMADVSLLSGPWLVLPFMCGMTQRTSTAAAVLGFGCTFAALAGYALMTLSPMEGAHLTATSLAGFVHSSSRDFIGGLFSGPLFGWLGYRWRRGAQAWAGWAAAGTLLLEPAARQVVGQPIRSTSVLAGEVVAGLLCAAWLRRTRRRPLL